MCPKIRVIFVLFLLQQPNAFGTLPQILQESFGTPTLCTLFSASHTVDNLMANSLKHLKGPIKLPIINMPLFSLVLYDGEVYGLDNMERSGSADAGCIGDWVVVRTSFITTQPTHASYSWRFGLFGGQVNVIIKKSKLDMTLKLGFQAGKESLPKIHLVDVQELDGISVQLDGLSALNTKLSWIASVIVNTLQSQVARLVNPLLLEFVNTEILTRLTRF